MEGESVLPVKLKNLKKNKRNSQKESKKKSKKRKRKTYAELEPTTDYWSRMDYVKSRTNWMFRLSPWLKERSEQCKTCQMGYRCNRIPLNERITARIAEGKECPDYKSVWNRIVGGKEEYDWGF